MPPRRPLARVMINVDPLPMLQSASNASSGAVANLAVEKVRFCSFRSKTVVFAAIWTVTVFAARSRTKRVQVNAIKERQNAAGVCAGTNTVVAKDVERNVAASQALGCHFRAAGTLLPYVTPYSAT